MKKLFAIFILALTINATAQIPTDSLSLWLSSDFGVISNNTDVTVWEDRSGNARNAIATMGNPQIVQNEVCGKPVIRFNGYSNGMTIPSFETFSNMRGAIIIVGRINGPGNGAAGYGTFISTWVGSGVAWQFAVNLNDYSWYDGVGGSATPITSSPPSQWGILTLNRNNDNILQFYKSGVLVQNKTVAANQPTPNSIKIGYSGSYEVLNGDIAEIIIYNKSLDDTEIYQVNTYLANKYCFNRSINQPMAINQSSCFPTSFTLIASGGSQYRWYDEISSTTPLSTSSEFITPVLQTTDTFFVANYNDTLESVRTMVIATIHMSPDVNFTLENDTIHLNSAPIVLTGGMPVGGAYSGVGVSEGVFYPNIAGVGLTDIIYTYVDSNTCSKSDTAKIYVDFNTRMEHFEVSQDFEIYPNPTHDYLIIDLKNNHSKIKRNLKLQVTNSLSQIVYLTTINSQLTTIDLSSLNGKGIFFVHLIDGENNTIDVRKIVLK